MPPANGVNRRSAMRQAVDDPLARSGNIHGQTACPEAVTEKNSTLPVASPPAQDIMRYKSAVLPISAACPWNWPSAVTRFQMVVSRIQKCRPDLAMRMPE